MSLLRSLLGPEKAKVVLQDSKGKSVSRFMVGNLTPLDEVNDIVRLHYDNFVYHSDGPRTLTVSYGGIQRELRAKTKGVIYFDEVFSLTEE